MTEHDDKQMARVDTVADVAPSKGRRRFVKAAIVATPAVMAITRGRLAVAGKWGNSWQSQTNTAAQDAYLSAGSSINPGQG